MMLINCCIFSCKQKRCKTLCKFQANDRGAKGLRTAIRKCDDHLGWADGIADMPLNN